MFCSSSIWNMSGLIDPMEWNHAMQSGARQPCDHLPTSIGAKQVPYPYKIEIEKEYKKFCGKMARTNLYISDSKYWPSMAMRVSNWQPL